MVPATDNSNGTFEELQAPYSAEAFCARGSMDAPFSLRGRAVKEAVPFHEVRKGTRAVVHKNSPFLNRHSEMWRGKRSLIRIEHGPPGIRRGRDTDGMGVMFIPECNDSWVRDYMPLACIDGKGCPVFYGPSELGAIEMMNREESVISRDAARKVFQETTAGLLGVEIRRLDIAFQFGNFTLLGDDAVCMTRKVLRDNLISPQIIADECARLGIEKLILIPEIDNTGHSDSAVSRVRETVFVPEVPGCFREISVMDLNRTREAQIDLLRLNSDLIAGFLVSEGFNVERLPVVDFEWNDMGTFHFLSPVNLHLEVSSDGLEAWMPLLNGEDDRFCALSARGRRLRATTVDACLDRLHAAGIERINGLHISPKVGGGAHCLTGFIPPEIPLP